jgi:hypothetical protein
MKPLREHARDLAQFDSLSDIQDIRPLALNVLEAACQHG